VTAVLGGLRERLAGSTSTKPAKGGTKSLRVSPATKKATKSGKASDVKLAPAQRFNITLPGIQSKNAKGIPVEIGFTAANELFVGRMAMVGWALSLAGELLTGLGPLAQLGYETGVPIQDVEYGILALAGFNLLAALTPVSGRFVDEEALQRPAGPLQDNSISMVEPKKFFGVSGFGQFSKDNELFVGRVAQLGFAASLIGEAVTGKGALAQLNLETGIPLNEAEPLLLALIAFLFLASINEGRGKFIRDGN